MCSVKYIVVRKVDANLDGAQRFGYLCRLEPPDVSKVSTYRPIAEGTIAEMQKILSDLRSAEGVSIHLLNEPK